MSPIIPVINFSSRVHYVIVSVWPYHEMQCDKTDHMNCSGTAINIIIISAIPPLMICG